MYKTSNYLYYKLKTTNYYILIKKEDYIVLFLVWIRLDEIASLFAE